MVVPPPSTPRVPGAAVCLDAASAAGEAVDAAGCSLNFRAAIAVSLSFLMSCTCASIHGKLRYSTSCSLQNCFTRTCALRRLCRGSRGHRWCSTWNCSPPWNQSCHHGQSTFNVVATCMRNHSSWSPLYACPWYVSCAKWLKQICTCSVPASQWLSNTTATRSGTPWDAGINHPTRRQYHAANPSKPATSSPLLCTCSLLSNKIQLWAYKLNRANAMTG
mmetsp:Transcript_19224/g.38061  ORF Transcript_19224/g.38061 Transcript_19224/m.38061 type:complete len:219 (+) Transcript_19224:451-1107(+)